ncbi:MAG: alanine racemase [Hyphomicrobiales bacterium]|nr:alanine racemase [Hyphomicrobiales bacterium]MCP4997454.1 alanine racemase [Hyphomicrobiales bacterium]
MKDEGHGARLTIDIGVLVDNWRAMQKLSSPARCSAVVKADGYGLGAEAVSTALYEAGCRDFFVATAHEGAAVRRHTPEARIYVMNCILPGIEEICRAAELVPVLASMENVAHWTSACAANGEHPCALQVDTGMNRLGLTVAEAVALSNDITRPAGFSPVLIMSHLACADEPDHPHNNLQLDAFRMVASTFGGVETSFSNSAGIMLGTDFKFDLTRPGIAIYGGAVGHHVKPRTKPVVTAEARIVTIRRAKRGETVSYGATVTLDRDSRVAVCSIGYADGYLRALSGAGVTLRAHDDRGAHGHAHGRILPVLGRVTMDLTAFDITDLPDGALKPGDFIELFGNNVALDDVARAGGTIGYELLTSLGSRYQRLYVNRTRED